MTLPKGEKHHFIIQCDSHPLSLSNMPYVPVTGRLARISGVTGLFTHGFQSDTISCKKKNKAFATLAQWQAVRQRASTPTGPQLRGCPCGGREQRPEVMVGGAAQPWTHLMPSPGGDSFPHFNKMPKQKTKPGILIFYLQKLLSHRKMKQLNTSRLSYYLQRLTQLTKAEWQFIQVL